MSKRNPSTLSVTLTPLAPVSASERIDTIDVLRGFAIFGVLIAFAVWSLGSPPFDTYSMPDKVLTFVLNTFVNSKFYTLLSFLFGLGFAIQLSRARESGASIVPVYCRRLLVMMVLGFAHALLLRNGDILVPYATVGFALLLFRNASNKALFAGAVLGAFLPFIARTIWELIGIPVPARPETEGMGHFAANFEWVKYWYSTAIIIWPEFLTMFLAGLYVGRTSVFENIAAHKKGLRRLAVAGFVLGGGVFVGRLVVISMTEPNDSLSNIVNMTLVFTWHVHAWGFAAFYAAVIMLLLQRRRIKAISAPLAAVGRMSLTNYLLQAGLIVPICVVFDLYDKVTPSLALMLALIVAAIQVPFSVIWLRYFRFGPAEWVWRSLTYGRMQPMRLSQRAGAPMPALEMAD